MHPSPYLLLFALLLPAALSAGEYDFKTYWGRELVFSPVATISDALSLHQGPLPDGPTPGRDGRDDRICALDVLTKGGNVIRLVKDQHRVAYSPTTVYDKGDAVAYLRLGRGFCVLTKEGAVVAESAKGFRELGRWPDARALAFGGETLYVLAGPGRILRVPGPGQEEVLYQSNAPIRSFAAGPLGVYFVGAGGIYMVTHAGRALQLVEGDPDEFASIVYGDNNNGGGNTIGKLFEGVGLHSPPYPRGLLYVVRKSGMVSMVGWDGDGGRLIDKASRFHGYSASDFNYYTFVDGDGAVQRMDFGNRHLSLIRKADSEIADYTSFQLVHCLLRKDGAIEVADENSVGSRPGAGAVALSTDQLMKDLRLQPWKLAGLGYRESYPVAKAWRLDSEDLAKDERPEVQAAKQLLPQVLAGYDPENGQTLDQHFTRWFEARARLRQALEPLRAARARPTFDLEEDLDDADRLLDRELVPESVRPECLRLVDEIVDQTLAKIEPDPCDGSRRLQRRLKNYKLKRKIGLLDWRLTGVGSDIHKDWAQGRWNPQS